MDNYHVAWCSLSYCRCVQSLCWSCLNCDFTAEVMKSFEMYPQLLYFFQKNAFAFLAYYITNKDHLL